MAAWAKRLLALALGTLAALALGEVVARRVVPPANGPILEPYRRLALEQTQTNRLPRRIDWRANSLGLRGPELPADSGVTRILCLGGSTTECTLLNDGQTWPDVMQEELTQRGHRVWVGNAGRDGLSTYGQLSLLPPLLSRVRPDFVLLLNGPNDIARTAPNPEDRDLALEPELHPSAWGRAVRRLARQSALVRALVLALRSLRRSEAYARRHDLAFELHVSPHPVNAEAVGDSVMAHRPYAESYRLRVDSLAVMIRAAGAVPVVITHSVLVGPHTSDSLDLQALAATPLHNGVTYWAILDTYNRAVCREALTPYSLIRLGSPLGATLLPKPLSLPCIDLAQQPTRPHHYYDLMHLGRVGAQHQGRVLADYVETLLAQQKLERDQQQQPAKDTLDHRPR
ncbi:MAG: GDSL-type esterase/lipase family protein [Gemmatimonadales bacterium]|nr:GDSL-type esterase/lipase family protein [Gemmatimonadales bacterium]